MSEEVQHPGHFTKTEVSMDDEQHPECDLLGSRIFAAIASASSAFFRHSSALADMGLFNITAPPRVAGV
jgi:hypothetical protein